VFVSASAGVGWAIKRGTAIIELHALHAMRGTVKRGQAAVEDGEYTVHLPPGTCRFVIGTADGRLHERALDVKGDATRNFRLPQRRRLIAIPWPEMRLLFVIAVLSVAAVAGPPEDLAAIRGENDASTRKRLLRAFLRDTRPAALKVDATAGVYNEAVTLAPAHKLKAKYLTKRIDVRRFGADPQRENPHFAFDLIRGPRWSWQPPQKHDVLVRRKAGVIARGEARRIRLHIWVYDLDRGNIANPSGSPKRAAGIWLEALKKKLRAPKVREKPVRRSFNKHYGKCYTFAVSGLDSKGAFLSHRCWFVRPKKGRLAMFQVEAADEKPDPELDAILATLRDP